MGGGRLAALVVATVAFLAAAALAGLVRRYALSRSLLDIPNERSSHSVPTPRGGGLAIVVVVLAGLSIVSVAGWVEPTHAVALGGGGTVVALVGWLDDREGLPAASRLVAHTAAAAWTVLWLGGMPRLTVGAGVVDLGVGGTLLAVVAVVWAVNLYNFMDGIDGLAAIEAVIAGLAGALLLAPRSPSLGYVALLVAAAAGGFLVWNWPPARLFMGDVGSGFLGFLFGGLAVASEQDRSMPALLWVLLLGPFFVDATLTLLRRVARGERWYVAHRTHAYQRAVQAGWSHRRVTGTVAALTLALGVGAAVAVRRPVLLGPILALGLGLLGAIYLGVERRLPMPSRPRSGGEPGATA